MWGPGNWSTKKVQERSADQHSFTYVISSVRDKLRVIDRDIGVIGINCTSILKKAKLDVPPPGIGARRKFRNVLQTSTHSLTDAAVLLSKVQV
jgi:hypothetical protein